MRIPALSGAATVLLLVVALTACSATPELRTQPDQVEQAAVSTAQTAALAGGLHIADDFWIQLWTPAQAGVEVAQCVARGSDGLVVYQAGPLASNSEGLSYSVFTAPQDASVDGEVGPPVLDGPTAQRLVDGCIAEYPVDFRLFSVPERDRGALYAYDLTVLRRCLLSHGQTVPTMPSRERFENLMRASAPWNAYEHVRVRTRAEWYALVDACPALPTVIAGDVASVTTSATTP
ncbi:MAG: hypothetical protein M3N46_02160 [Actinomycetota bacterium]|nr:hypothetical protein [Actinomycetota bacterium]